jgi:hypothetical protein
MMHWIYYFFADLNLSPVPKTPAGSDQLQNIVNTILAVAGAIAVLIIVLAGFRLITSQGDPGAVATARNAVIYSLIGLVVIMFAFAIVNFVLLGVG